MKRVGIIGGLGPEATTDYYKEIINRFKEINPDSDLNYPEIIIYSVNMATFIGHMQNADYKSATEYLSYCIHQLENAGADFIAISSNTPHLLFNELKKTCNRPIISIVETAKTEAKKLKLKKIGLIGTKFTMQTSFYADVFNQSGIELVVPDSNDIEIINNKLFTEIELGLFKDETKTLILDIVQKMIEHHNIEALILGCTEFPLMFTKDEYLNIPFINTTRVHVAEIVNYCLSES